MKKVFKILSAFITGAIVFFIGNQLGYDDGKAAGYLSGHEDGYSEGYTHGMEKGYTKGYHSACLDNNE